MDCLPLDEVDLVDDWQDMYWKYGQKIYSAAHIVRDDPRLHAIYITNFACGPDSFILHFFKEKMRGKPYLQIEVDEHSADVGAITRLEAFLDSLKNIREDNAEGGTKTEDHRPHQGCRPPQTLRPLHGRAGSTPWWAPSRPAESTRRSLPSPTRRPSYWGRKYTSGKECYPCILTTGDMVRVIKSPDFDRNKVAFFMPSGNGPCRFGQYHRLHRLILDDLGYPDVPIYSPTQDEHLYRDLGHDGEELHPPGLAGDGGHRPSGQEAARDPAL